MTAKTKPLAVLYLRQSQTDGSDDKLAVDRQEKECRDWAKRNGYKVSAVYVDNDISATTGAARPAFERLLVDRPPVVIVFHADRLVRLMTELERVIAALPLVHAVHSGLVDLSTPAGRMVARQITAVSQYEGEQKVLRMRAAHRQRAEQGKPWGPAPFGYRTEGTEEHLQWLLDPDTAPLVQDAFVRFLAGETITSIAADWTEQGILTPRGNAWRQGALSNLLRNPSYAGLRTHETKGDDGKRSKVIVGPGNWEPLVPEETWRAAVRRITDPGRRTGGSATATYLLTGIARCGICGATVRKGQRTKDRVAFYRCNAEHHLSRTGAPCDDAVTALLAERLAQPDVVLSADPDTTAADERATLLARLDDLGEDYAAGLISRGAMHKGTERLRGQIAALDQRLERDDRRSLQPLTGATAEECRALLDSAPLTLRRNALSLLLDVWVVPRDESRAVAVPDDARTVDEITDTGEPAAPYIAVRWRS